MNEQVLKRTVGIKYLKMMIKIFKDKISALQKIQQDNKSILKLNKNLPDNTSKLNEENENKIPQFMTLSKLDWTIMKFMQG